MSAAGQCLEQRAAAAPAACRQPLPLPPPRLPTATCPVLYATYTAGPASAPSLSDGGDDDQRPSTSGRPPPQPPTPQGPSPLRQLYKRTLKQLANLKLAIAELAAIAALSSVGTVIKQGEPYSYYVEVGRQGGVCACLPGWQLGAGPVCLAGRGAVLPNLPIEPGLISRSTC